MNKIGNEKWPKISAIMPCFNGMKFLPISLKSLSEIDYPNLEIILIDDASNDGTVRFINENYPEYNLICHDKNRGFANTINEGFSKSTGKYVFFVNQDTVHNPDYLKICVKCMEKRPDLAAITGKVYKFDFEKNKKLKILDSIGLEIFKNRRIVDIGQGEKDIGQYEQAREVFGVSGQNPLYRRVALKEVASSFDEAQTTKLTQSKSSQEIANDTERKYTQSEHQSLQKSIGYEEFEIFDKDFFMYKEDCDLAWRLRLAGWKAWYEPHARAWHGRATSAIRRINNLEILKNRRKLNYFQKFHSVKNRYLLMYKNEVLLVWLLHLPIIIFYDILYFGYNLIFDFRILGAYFSAIKKLPSLKRKRRQIMQNRRITTKEIRSWMK